MKRVFVRRASAGLFVIAAFAVTHGCGQSKVAFTQTEKLIAPKTVVTISAKDNNAQASLKKDAPIPNPTGPKEDQKIDLEKLRGNIKLDEQITEKFSLMAAAPSPSDFVFVVDSSRSMEPLIEKFIRGFESIPLEKYPPNTRLAVMNMIGHKLDDSNTPLAEYQFKPEFLDLTLDRAMKIVKAEPGYLKFVNAAGVENFRSVVAQNGSISSYDGSTHNAQKLETYKLCESEWFKPEEKNNDVLKPKSCLGAAMQISGFVGVETGLLSISQLMKKNIGKPGLFRDDASVHFVIISDTHDPGFTGLPESIKYKDNLPKFQEIDALVRVNSNVKKVKLHGVVPFSACESSELKEVHGLSYLPEIKASGGVAVDQCDENVKYDSVVNQILNEARKSAFKLNVEAAKDVKVKVNGKDWTDFKLIGENSIELGGLLSSSSYEIEVSYTKVSK